MRLICTFAGMMMLALIANIPFAHGQVALPPSIQEAGGPEAITKERKNAWTVSIVTGQLEGTYPRIGHELAQVLDDGDNLRILPILAYGAASNLEDLLYLRGVDIAITQSDVFEYFHKQGKIPNLQLRVHYLIRLYDAETHILARPEIRTLAALRGKKVVFGPAGSAATLTGPILFDRLGIAPIEPVFVDHSTGLELMKAGEAAAMVRVAGKPADFFAKLPGNTGFHFLEMPFTANMRKLEDFYALGELTSKDYPALIPAGQRIETISVPNVLAVYNWPQDSDRYRRVVRFTEALFTKWGKFRQPQFHPKWREINPGASVPGWTRFDAADRMVKRLELLSARDTVPLSKFKAFLPQASRPVPRNRAEEEILFREFMSWRLTNSAP